jgi:Ca2+-binding RTX toxin-like protein
MREQAEPKTQAASTHGGEQIAATQAGQAPPAQAGTGPTTDTAKAAAPPHAGVEAVPPPSSGELVTIHAQPGEEISLTDKAFDPHNAQYTVDHGDLVVTLNNGGVLTVTDFFDTQGAPPTLSVLDGPAVPAPVLLERSVAVADVTEIEPSVGHANPNLTGPAQFTPFHPGNIGPGLTPLGPLGPVDFFHNVQFGERTVFLTTEGNGGPTPPPGAAPVVTVASDVTGVVGITTDGYNPPSDAALPLTHEGQTLTESEINGLPANFVTLDQTRSVDIVFNNEVALYKNALVAYEVASDGTIGHAKIVFPDVNSFATTPSFQDGTGPLHPGDTFSLGTYEAGTTLGFALIQNAWNLNAHDLLTTGTIEVIDPNTGQPLNINSMNFQNGGLPPEVVHVAVDGTETVLNGFSFFTSDASEWTPDHNRLNVGLQGHVIHGYDPATGATLFSFEDGYPASDRDFNDATFGFQPSDTVDGHQIAVGDSQGLLHAQVSDTDSTQLEAAHVSITAGGQAGDELLVAGLTGDGTFAGTSIAVHFASPTDIQLSGVDTLQHYTDVLNAVTYGSGSTDPHPGQRTVTVTVTDDSGNVSDPASTVVDITNHITTLTAGNDDYAGTFHADAILGLGGNDIIHGAGGNDIINGGSGNDALIGDSGNDTLQGSSGADTLYGGTGADTFVYTALSDGTDTIGDFNQAQGDRLDLTKFFQGTGFDPNGANASSYLSFQQAGSHESDVVVDRDGSGSQYQAHVAFHILNQADPSALTIASATTYGHVTDGATT